MKDADSEITEHEVLRRHKKRFVMMFIFLVAAVEMGFYTFLCHYLILNQITAL